MLVTEKQAFSQLSNLRVSPRKVNLVVQAIRGKKVDKALAYLKFCNKRVADDVYKVLRSAISNAEYNNGLDVDNLVVKQAYVGKGSTLKRFHARARGKGARILKRFSHVSIIVEEVNNGSKG